MQVKKIIVGNYRTNCYIAINEETGDCVIIDPGASPEDIVNSLKQEHITAKAIILTHGHFDHIGGAEMIRQLLHIPIYAGINEAGLLKDADMNCSESMGSPYTLEADYLLKDNEKIEIAGLQYKIINTPGHTAGSICIYHEQGREAFVGDTVFFRSVGRTDLPTGNIKKLDESCKRLALLEDETVFYCGHGPQTVLGNEKRLNSYFRGL